jgi:cytosine/adenosine deaminase-related metal-dependent hydrolase
LAGLTRRGDGFVPWLQSLIPLAAKPALPELLLRHLHEALEQVRRGGTAHVGDVGSRNPALVARAAGQGCGLTHFLEVFGFSRPPLSDSMPQQLAAQGYCPPAASSLTPEAWEGCAIAGHALYSTAPEGLRAAFAWCREHRRPFSIHLAESAEEEDCLLRGKGDLHELLCERLLPADWRHPGMRPVEYADRLGLLGPRTLAVHCVHCSPEDTALLARRRVNICLCPRSNRFIGVGLSMAKQLLEQELLLCLGTDSLASNDDLDMREELRAARELWGFSAEAVLRMATVNAAYALGLDHLGALMPGKAAAFFIYKEFASCSP